jgi:hypothetical protein
MTLAHIAESSEPNQSDLGYHQNQGPTQRQESNELNNLLPGGPSESRPHVDESNKSAQLVNEFLRLTIAIVSAAENQNDSNYAEFNAFFKILFCLFDKLPVVKYKLNSQSRSYIVDAQPVDQ